MPPRGFSQHLHSDENLPQTSTQNHPSTQILSTIAEGSEHLTFSDVPEVQLQHQVNNTSTNAVGSSQNVGGASSTQTNEGAPHHSPPRAPLPIQVIQGDAEIKQVQVPDWEEEALDEKATEEEELLRVQQEIERLCQEQ
jgi:hypothetical protein